MHNEIIEPSTNELNLAQELTNAEMSNQNNSVNRNEFKTSKKITKVQKNKPYKKLSKAERKARKRNQFNKDFVSDTDDSVDNNNQELKLEELNKLVIQVRSKTNYNEQELVSFINGTTPIDIKISTLKSIIDQQYKPPKNNNKTIPSTSNLNVSIDEPIPSNSANNESDPMEFDDDNDDYVPKYDPERLKIKLIDNGDKLPTPVWQSFTRQELFDIPTYKIADYIKKWADLKEAQTNERIADAIAKYGEFVEF